MTTKWKPRVRQAISAGGTGAITLGSALSGFQALAAGEDGFKIGYWLEDGINWESGYGTYTSSGTSFARTSIEASSNAGAAINVTTAGIFTHDFTAVFAQGADLAAQSIIPGGRLTLTSGSPVTTSDVIGATSVYYTPFIHNCITLWDGNRWQPVSFSEITQALGTLTSGKPYDVFGYLSSGALATELLAWTNDTTRATAVTLQDGRYCKSGDKTRHWLGAFRTTATTTTEDSAGGTTTQVGGRRLLFNAYNRIPRHIAVKDTTTAWVYKTATWRQANAAAGNKVEILLGLADIAISAVYWGTIALQGSSSRAALGIGIDSTTSPSGFGQSGYGGASTYSIAACSAAYRGQPGLGRHDINALEIGATGTDCQFTGNDTGQNGLYVEALL